MEAAMEAQLLLLRAELHHILIHGRHQEEPVQQQTAYARELIHALLQMQTDV